MGIIDGSCSNECWWHILTFFKSRVGAFYEFCLWKKAFYDHYYLLGARQFLAKVENLV